MAAGAGLSRIDSLVARVRSSDPPALVLQAPGGSGKTEALDAVASALAEVDRGFERVTGRRQERDLPWGAIEHLLAGTPPADEAGVAAARRELESRLAGSTLLIDDGQWIDVHSIRALTQLAGRAGDAGIGFVVSSRPVADGEVASFVSVVGDVVAWPPLSSDEIAARVAATLGVGADSSLVEALVEASAGRLALVDLLLGAWQAEGLLERGALPTLPAEPLPDVIRAIGTVVGALAADERELLEALAVSPWLDDEVVAALTGVDVSAVAPLASGLGSAGLLVDDKQEPPPIVASCVLAALAEAQERELHRRLADVLSARGGAVGPLAEALAAAGVAGTEAAGTFVAAGDALLDEAPGLAGAWFERAVAAGAEEGRLAARRGEVALFDGRFDEALRYADAVLAEPSLGDIDRARRVAGALMAARGQSRRSASLLLDQDDRPWRLLAAPSLLACGDRPALASILADVAVGPGLYAESLAVLAAGLLAASGDHPDSASPLLFEAADLVEAAGAERIGPDSAHAVGAVLLTLLTDFTAAAHLLTRGVDHRAGGALLDDRHRLLTAWVALRAGEWAQAGSGAGEVGDPQGPRDAMVAAAIELGLARRSGDLVRMADGWARAEQVVVRTPADLFSLEFLAEIAISAARLDSWERAAGRLDELDTMIRALDDPVVWAVPMAWARVQAGVGDDDPARVSDAAETLRRLLSDATRLAPIGAAADAWASLLGGSVDAGEVLQAAEGLAGMGMAWEASRLSGQAAVRIEDPEAARQLLEAAREFKGAVAGVEPEPGVVASLLSDRELEVARRVVDGNTYKEIGAQLYISPKTVEHHVAKIRQKLGASTRAEMLAALRSELGD